MIRNTELIVLACSFIAISAYISHTLAEAVPNAYMDEIFHIPQTQRYCMGDWNSWDSKITTFPGLYFLGAATGHFVSLAADFLGSPLPLDSDGTANAGCSTVVLRAVNVVLATCCIPVIYYLAHSLDARRTKQQLIVLSIVCCTFPVHFFYTFLYYTDVGSTLFTLCTWLAAQHGHPWWAGILAACAVMMRQTNSVWIAFIGAHTALEMCLPRKKGRISGSASQRDGTLEGDIKRVLKKAWILKWTLLASMGPMVAVVVAFAVFVVYNGGIVLGDRDNHAPVKHFMQPLYFALYCTAALAPAFWTPHSIINTGRSVWRQLCAQPLRVSSLAVAVVGAAIAAVTRGTLVHPFLLADNRHYTFYLWRRVVNVHPWSRYALILSYVFSIYSLDRNLRLAGRHALVRGLLAATIGVVLIPAHLIEFRYFTVPFYAVVLLGKTPTVRQLAAVAVAYAVCNAATLYVFMFRPFEWPDGSVARFLW